MEFNIRLLNDSDYDNTLVNWWKDWEWTAPAKEYLPENGIGGFMVSKGDVDICAGFVYLTNSKLAWSEFIISNKNYKEEDRSQAIEYLIDTICLSAKDAGYLSIWTCVYNEHLVKKYENCGFKKTDSSATEMIKVL